MKVIIAGGRNIINYELVTSAVHDSQFEITEIVSGGAAGVDTLAIEYAVENDLPFTIYEADWDRHGKAAGPIRNFKMAKNAEALIAIWDGESRGTRNMIEEAKRVGIKVYVKKI